MTKQQWSEYVHDLLSWSWLFSLQTHSQSCWLGYQMSLEFHPCFQFVPGHSCAAFSKSSGSFWAIFVRWRMVRSFLFIKQVYQPADALKFASTSLANGACFAIFSAYSRMAVRDTAKPFCRWSDIHSYSAFSSDGNAACVGPRLALFALGTSARSAFCFLRHAQVSLIRHTDAQLLNY